VTTESFPVVSASPKADGNNLKPYAAASNIGQLNNLSGTRHNSMNPFVLMKLHRLFLRDCLLSPVTAKEIGNRAL
jgi:hypothetical protein